MNEPSRALADKGNGMHPYDPNFQPKSPRVTRRRFMEIAILSGSTVVLPVPLVWAKEKDKDEEHYGMSPDEEPGDWEGPPPEEIQAPPDGDWNSVFEPSSHWSSSPRKGVIMVHHNGSPNTGSNTACTSCNSGGNVYDFCIARNGNICNTGRFSSSSGAHGYPCNSCSVGVMMQGCYGGCTSGNLAEYSDAQLCALAVIMLHLETPAEQSRLRPHKYCEHMICDCSGCTDEPTKCPGTNLSNHQTVSHWNTTGSNLMARVIGYLGNLKRGCSCTGIC